jgi:hypothetical protein
MADQQAGQAPRRIVEIQTEEIPLGGPNEVVTCVRSGKGRTPRDGWVMTETARGVVCEKDGRAGLIPWTKVKWVEYAPAEATQKGKAA